MRDTVTTSRTMPYNLAQIKIFDSFCTLSAAGAFASPPRTAVRAGRSLSTQLANTPLSWMPSDSRGTPYGPRLTHSFLLELEPEWFGDHRAILAPSGLARCIVSAQMFPCALFSSRKMCQTLPRDANIVMNSHYKQHTRSFLTGSYQTRPCLKSYPSEDLVQEPTLLVFFFARDWSYLFAHDFL